MNRTKVQKSRIPRRIPSPASLPQDWPLPPAGEVLDSPLSFRLKDRSIIFCGTEHAMHSTLAKTGTRHDFQLRTHKSSRLVLTTSSQHPRKRYKSDMARENTQGSSSRSLADVERRHPCGLQVLLRVRRVVIRGFSPTSKYPLSDLAIAWQLHGCRRCGGNKGTTTFIF
jgi:hypothetical protein